MFQSIGLGNQKFVQKIRVAVVIERYAAKIPIKEIAKEFEIAESTVMKYVRKAGLNRYRNHKELRPKVVAAYVQGIPLKEITATYAVDRKTIWNWVSVEGFPLRKKHKDDK